MQVPHSLVGKKADPFFKPLPAGSTATYQSPTKISAETQGVKIDKNPSKKLHVEGKITPTQLRKTASVSSSSNAIPKNMESYRPLIEKHAQINNLDPNLLAALIKQESNFRPDVVSHAGAMGLTQLMPGTARSVGVTDPLNPEQSIAGGARYLRQMLDRFNGNTELALAAYNAGPGAVARYGGIPPFRETRRYVQSVTANLENIRSTGLFASTSPPKTRV
ncbi:MAG TPA: lytic transglycosylase [Deltaproteobacteria bacterium]|nr:lytic transglycosylase [Deltaproteobacteria bacterium]